MQYSATVFIAVVDEERGCFFHNGRRVGCSPIGHRGFAATLIECRVRERACNQSPDCRPNDFNVDLWNPYRRAIGLLRNVNDPF